MRTLIPTLLAGCAMLGPAAAEPLTPISFRMALEAAKTYAADRTLVFYCLRQQTDMVPYMYLTLHRELEDALVKLQVAGSDAKQNAELVQTVMTNVRFPGPGATDPKLDEECKAKNVEQSYYTFQGSFSVPLANRQPFSTLTR
jgi:hypothetical protein